MLLQAAILATLLGCSGATADPKEREVVLGVGRVKALINSTAISPMAALSLASLAEQGGTIISFIAASLPDNESFTCYIEGPLPQPYCVTVQPGPMPGEYLITGYGQDIGKPIASDRAIATTPRRK